jgi:hypothetical protein
MIPHIRQIIRQTSKSNQNKRSKEATARREARVGTDARVLRPGKVVIETPHNSDLRLETVDYIPFT